MGDERIFTNRHREPGHRPRVAFAMSPIELREGLISPDAMQRLTAFADVIDAVALTRFDTERARQILAHTDVLITGWGCPFIDDGVLAQAPDLSLIAHAGGAIKGYISVESWQRGISVTTAANANSRPVAEYLLGMVLLCGKRIFEAERVYRSARSAFQKSLLPVDIGNCGRTVGIIGASKIGRELCRLLQPFDFHCLISDPTIDNEEAARIGAIRVSLDELMGSSDIVSLNAPVLPSTIGMIDRGRLALMRDGTFFINTARGVLVDHAALREEAQSGRLNLILDVTDPEPLPDNDPLRDLPDNVILTPHIAGSLGNELQRLGNSAIEEVRRLASGEPLQYPVSMEQLAHMA